MKNKTGLQRVGFSLAHCLLFALLFVSPAPELNAQFVFPAGVAAYQVQTGMTVTEYGSGRFGTTLIVTVIFYDIFDAYGNYLGSEKSTMLSVIGGVLASNETNR